MRIALDVKPYARNAIAGAPSITKGTQTAVNLSMALCVLVGWSR